MAGSSTTTDGDTSTADRAGRTSVRPLAGLAPGASARVVRVLPAAGPEVARRLADLGFTPGAVVHVVRRAPLRDPVEYRVKDYDICLRRAQAACIEVTIADADAPAKVPAQGSRVRG